MGTKTGIAWTESTWNPIRGCRRVSAGCMHCYAEAVAARFNHPGGPYEGLATTVNGHPAWTGKVVVVEKHLYDPLKWQQPRRIFVNSMSDLFYEPLAEHDIIQIIAVMALAPRHIFQVLTKRPERMAALLGDASIGTEVWLRARQIAYERHWAVERWPDPLNHPEECPWPLPNVWWGTSVEDQAAAQTRLIHLLRTPAAVRFISAEPLLGPISLEAIPVGQRRLPCYGPDYLAEAAPASLPFGAPGIYNTLSGEWWPALGNPGREYDERITDLPKLDWVIIGGESGPQARPMAPAWALDLIIECQNTSTACFMKQVGSVLARQWHLQQSHGADPAEWPEGKGGWHRDYRPQEYPNEMPPAVVVGG